MDIFISPELAIILFLSISIILRMMFFNGPEIILAFVLIMLKKNELEMYPLFFSLLLQNFTKLIIFYDSFIIKILNLN